MERFLFDGWTSLLRTGVVGILAYIVLIIFLRITGRRTLSKMNAFDFVVTVALGSTLATILLSKEVTLAQGAAAFGLLVGLQFVVTWMSVRISWVKRVVTGEPALIMYRGAFLQDAMRRVRVTEDEVLAAVRSAGHLELDTVDAVVLETDGSFSVVQRGQGTGPSSLRGVGGAGARRTGG